MAKSGFIIVSALLLLPVSFGQNTPAAKEYLGAAVDSRGAVYVLADQHVRAYDSAGKERLIPLKLARTANDPAFTRLICQAVAVSEKDEMAVLWSGLRMSGAVETYVFMAGSGRSVKLGRPLGTAFALALSSNGNIYVFGIPKNEAPALLIHEFGSDGRFSRSFHPGDDAFDIDSRRKLGRSQMVAMGDMVYVLSPLRSRLIYEYLGGTLTATHDLSALGPNGSSRRVISIFRQGSSLLAHTSVKAAAGGASQNEIIRIADGSVYRSIGNEEIVGPILGIAPNGGLIQRNAGASAARNTIAVR